MGAESRQGEDIDSPASFEAARMQLARLHASPESRLRDLWLQLAETAASTLNVERVGAWILVDEKRALRCRYLLQYSNHQIYQGAVLRDQDFPNYFQALEQHRTIAVEDAPTSPLTAELREVYLEPLGITSLLDAPIYVGGKVAGVVCHEHIGAPRVWTEAERDFAATVADTIARVYGEFEHRHAETALESYQRHMMELHRMEALGRMAAGVAHDFRGIVSIALGFTELLRRVPNLSPQADHYAQRVVDALQRGQSLTEEIMSFGKDDPVAPRVLDVASTLSRCSQMFRVLVGSSIRLRVRGSSTVSRIFMDTSQFERMMLNLVLNARDAMPNGGSLDIDYEDSVVGDEDDERATYVAISVRDTGVGMDEQTRLNAFKPFFTTKGDRGTGLGLVIIDQIVSRAGGRVKIDSEVGRGTTMQVYLPRIAAAC
ncbi:MAG TPA: ATP-binding protein [Steroidobacter sp.]|uniref:sensor histidine kinase n=1 Tax=Steroidobacter sp. TaxID=1978227 RepID=UPI002ED97255